MTMDADGRTQEHIARLDSSRNLQGVKQEIQARLRLLELAPGQRVIEVGSGTGDFAREIAAVVGPSGGVTGLDLSSAMVATATERIAGTGLPLTFQVGDVHHLDFPDQSFDRACAASLFVHVDDPVRALEELVRVIRPGGRIVLRESAPGAFVFFGADFQTTNALREVDAQGWRNPWIGLQMLQLFRDAGLTDLTVEPHTHTSTSLQAVLARRPYRDIANRALQDGMVEAEQMNAWWRSLEEADRAGIFFWSITGFVFAAQRP
jgi:ubiquinone/menaquinone biosynthesis C-methylase UbiE